MSSRLRASLAVFTLLGSLLVAASPAYAKEPPADEVLQEVVDRLGEMAPLFDPRAVMAITVVRLDNRQRASFQGSEQVKSASVTKALWMAAAVRNGGVDKSVGIASRVLYASSNESAGLALDIAGGIDAVNEYVHDLGLQDTTVYEWSFGRHRRSRLYPGPLRGLNLTTTDDLADFWQMLAYGYALEGAERDALIEWTTGPKEDGEGNRLIARLPEEVGAGSAFKMGWLPVGRTYVIEDDETGWGGEEPGEEVTLFGGAVSSAAGIIRVPDGPSYVVAIAGYNGRSWRGMTAWVEYVSCVLYRVIADDPGTCTTSYDPARVASRVSAPDGAVTGIQVRHGFVTITGWAHDPDAWWDPTFVRFSVDGEYVGGWGSAVPHGNSDLFAPIFRHRLVGDLAPGVHEVCAVAVNDGSGDDTVLGCQTLSIAG